MTEPDPGPADDTDHGMRDYARRVFDAAKDHEPDNDDETAPDPDSPTAFIRALFNPAD